MSGSRATAHMGSRTVAEFLLAEGAPIEICTAAMLGRRSEVDRFLADDPGQIQACGAHGITLLSHAALSGDVSLVSSLFERGAQSGQSYALGNAVGQGRLDVVRWLLENTAPDLSWQNFQGHTVRQIAEERGHTEISRLLQDYSERMGRD